MFSFLKFFNSKSDADKNMAPNNLSGKTLNLNSPEAKALNIFNNKLLPGDRKSNGNNNSLRSDCKETVISPGLSFRIAQRAREMRPTTPNTDGSNLSTSYVLENSLNSSSTMNGIISMRDGYDKKRKLMETLDNFGVKKRTRQEIGVDAFVNRRRKTINDSNTPDRLLVMNGHNHRSSQPISIVMSSKNVNMENKKLKRHGDFGTNICHPQKKPRTQNNEILSSYSSSKFLVTPGQKRSYPTDHDSESPSRKHCKSCTCCGSTILLESDQNNIKKSDKTTETDLSDDLVTVAASRIFNRSGKTQVVKKISMKTILDEVFDDIDPIPYTSIDKLKEKRKKDTMNEHCSGRLKNGIEPPTNSDSLSTTSKSNEKQLAVTSITSTNSCDTSIVTSSAQSTTPLMFNHNQSESTLKEEGNKNNALSQFKFGSPTASVTLVETNHKQTNDIAGKTNDNQSSESTNNINTLETSKSPNEQHKLQFQSPDLNKNNNDLSQVEGEIDSKSDKNVPSFQFTVPASKPNEPIVSLPADSNSKINESTLPAIQFGSPGENTSKQPSFTFQTLKSNDKQSTPVMQFGASKVDDKKSTPVMQLGSRKVEDKQSTPVLQFGSPKVDDKQLTPVMQFGTAKANDTKSTPVMQFGVSKVDEKQSTPVMQFGTPKIDDKQSTAVLQFGAPKIDNKQSTPVMQFGAPKVDDKKSTPVMQFGSPKVNEKQSTPVLQFGTSNTSKVDNQLSSPVLQFGTTKNSENPTSNSLFSFGDNQKSINNSKPIESVKFKFDSSKPDNTSSTESKNVAFGSNNVQSQNLFSFGKTDNISLTTTNPPNYDVNAEKSTPKLQFGSTLPSSVFGTSNTDQSKPQFTTPVSQPVDSQGPKLVFGNQIAENKTTSIPGMLFSNNTANPVFQFNSSSTKLNDKSSEAPTNSFQFSSTKTAPIFGATASQDKPAFQFNAQKTEETKTQFSTPAFGSQNTNTPFKFGGNDKPTSFGNTFSPPNQPLQFTNNTEKTTQPFKFGSTAPPNNAFQFSANKTDSGPVKFGQTSNTFSTSGFSGFGNAASQQTSSFGGAQPSQPSPFNNITSPSAAPTFGSVASPPSSNAFGTNQSFQFGSTNNVANSSSTFAFGGSSQPAKPEGTFNFNAAPSSAVSPFQFGQSSSTLPTPQFGGTQPQGSFGFGSPPMTANGTSQSLFSMGAAPVGERRKAKAVRRRP